MDFVTVKAGSGISAGVIQHYDPDISAYTHRIATCSYKKEYLKILDSTNQAGIYSDETNCIGWDTTDIEVLFSNSSANVEVIVFGKDSNSPAKPFVLSMTYLSSSTIESSISGWYLAKSLIRLPFLYGATTIYLYTLSAPSSGQIMAYLAKPK